LESNPDDAFKIACLVREKRLASTNETYGVLEDDFQPSDQNIAKDLKRWWRISDLLAEFPKPTEIIDRALVNLARLVTHPMDNLAISHEDAAYLFFSPNRSSQTMLTYMDEMNLLRKKIVHTGGLEFMVAPAGWQRISDLQTKASDSKQAFVAMWFADEMDAFYENGMKAGITDAGFDAKRIDNKEHNNKICDEIIAEIRKSRFVVADFTGQRGGVYFEAGFAMGLGIPVIWTVRKDQIEQVHFDTRQYNHIVYDSAEDLKQKLCNRIRATIQ
jgi:nucleoside 2-deoxyribosyltransferase